jgi:anti-sigma B factor antagonist
MPAAPRITVQEESGLRIVQFQDRRLFDDTTVREVFEQLGGALPRNAATAVILDFSNVETLSSSMLGKLILIQRRMDGVKARLRLCEMNNTVRAVFRSTNLDRLFHIDRDLNESREALAGSGG